MLHLQYRDTVQGMGMEQGISKVESVHWEKQDVPYWKDMETLEGSLGHWGGLCCAFWTLISLWIWILIEMNEVSFPSG